MSSIVLQVTDWTILVGPALTAIASIIAAFAKRTGSGLDHRGALKADLETIAALPADSSARKALLEDVERRVHEGLNGDERRRDPAGIVLGFIFIALGIWLGVLALSATGFLLPVLIGGSLTAGALGLFGLVQDARKLERDEKGNPRK